MRFDRFLVRLFDASRAYGRTYPRPVESVSSLVCSFEVVKAFVLLPHQRHDDYREQDDNGHHHDQLEHRFHVVNLARSGASTPGIRQYQH